MRILVLFDLPVVTKKQRKIYARFRKALIKDGYDMIQFSVYQRICNGLDMADKYMQRLEEYAPKRGAIRAMILTERQLKYMCVITGKTKPKEKLISDNQCALF